jgi:ADP-ribosyl-[dinitrogen reductase] hydrolase
MRLYRAILLGTAAGDALGVPHEGVPRPRDLRAGVIVSDDTEMTALVAYALARHPRDREACVRAFRRSLLGWFSRLPWGIGWGTLRACIRIALDLRRTGVASAGNGAAMRIAIAGAFLRDRPRDERIAWVDAISEVTHVDVRAIEGARFVAELAALAEPERALEVVSEPSLRAALERAITLAREGATRERAASELGTSGFVVESVPFATFCALRFEPARALREAVLAGGDTDTNAAITGALAGALHGDGWVVPPRLFGAFGTAYLEALADDLENGTANARFSWPFALLTNVLTFPCILAHTMKALILLPVLALACGGAKPPDAKGTPDDSGESGLETPDTRCIAIARGERQRKGNEPTKITARHILVKFAGAKNASPDIKRTRGAACLRALEARKQLQSGESFADVVKEYSDEPGAATREGTVGQITRKDVAPTFADAAFELAPNEVSHVVETDFGYHIIMRVE